MGIFSLLFLCLTVFYDGILMMKKFLLLLLLTAAGIFLYLRQAVFAPGTLAEVTTVVVPKGAGLKVVAEKLRQARVIDKPWLFGLAARMQGLDRRLKAGEYQFEPGVSLDEVIGKLVRGDIFYRRITIPEGLTTGQILYLLASTPELEGEVSMEVKEGELLPETYSYVRGDSKDSIIRQAKEAMNRVIEQSWALKDDGLPLKNKREMLILASIIEKETAVASERPLVAAVFINRLRLGMRLQTDPSVIYAITEGEFELKRPLTRKDLAMESPYNTYKNYGLPPTPICNPGKEAIWAAAHPADHDYLYFVADGNGAHRFAKSLNDHNKNVREWKKQRSR